MARHLVLEFDQRLVPSPAVVACTGRREDFDRRKHTLLPQSTTCPDCKAAARGDEAPPGLVDLVAEALADCDDRGHLFRGRYPHHEGQRTYYRTRAAAAIRAVQGIPLAEEEETNR